MAILKFRKLTRAQFDALDVRDLNTRYTVEEPDNTLVEYIGDRPVSGGSGVEPPANKEVLDKLTEQEGKLLYNDQEIKPTPKQSIDEQSTHEDIPSAKSVEDRIETFAEDLADAIEDASFEPGGTPTGSRDLKVGDTVGDNAFEISDSDGNIVLAVTEGGHLKTKEFDSENIEVPGSVNVIANPLSPATDVINKLQINSKVYSIPSGADLETTGATYSGAKVDVKRKHYVDFEMVKHYTTMGTPQGGTNWEKYYFQFHDGNARCEVIDLDTLNIIQTITMPNPNSKYHCNNVAFGVEYHTSSDRFPLLYVSNEHRDMHNCCVYRITGNDGSMAITLVQTITFATPSVENDRWFPNIAIDRDKGSLICLTLKGASVTYLNSTGLTWDVFKIPKLSDGNVTLLYSDTDKLVKTFSISPAKLATQGSYTLNGKIYQPSGINGGTARGLFQVLDIEKEEWISFWDMWSDIPIEPEATCIYKDTLYMMFNASSTGKLYKFNFK